VNTYISFNQDLNSNDLYRSFLEWKLYYVLLSMCERDIYLRLFMFPLVKDKGKKMLASKETDVDEVSNH